MNPSHAISLTKIEISLVNCRHTKNVETKNLSLKRFELKRNAAKSDRHQTSSKSLETKVLKKTQQTLVPNEDERKAGGGGG